MILQRVAVSTSVKPVDMVSFCKEGEKMFKKGEYIVYKRDVCIVDDIKKNNVTGLDCYVLAPTLDASLKITVPVNTSLIRPLISKKEVDEIINNIPKTSIILSNNRLIENDYKELLHSGSHEDLIKIIKTTYQRNKDRKDNKKAIGEMDKEYFNIAERYLYNEFSYVLGLSYDDTKKYVVDMVENNNG